MYLLVGVQQILDAFLLDAVLGQEELDVVQFDEGGLLAHRLLHFVALHRPLGEGGLPLGLEFRELPVGTDSAVVGVALLGDVGDGDLPADS